MGATGTLWRGSAARAASGLPIGIIPVRPGLVQEMLPPARFPWVGAGGLPERVDEARVLRKVNRHLLTRFMALTVFCYLVSL